MWLDDVTCKQKLPWLDGLVKTGYKTDVIWVANGSPSNYPKFVLTLFPHITFKALVLSRSLTWNVRINFRHTMKMALGDLALYELRNVIFPLLSLR